MICTSNNEKMNNVLVLDCCFFVVCISYFKGEKSIDFPPKTLSCKSKNYSNNLLRYPSACNRVNKGITDCSVDPHVSLTGARPMALCRVLSKSPNSQVVTKGTCFVSDHSPRALYSKNNTLLLLVYGATAAQCTWSRLWRENLYIYSILCVCVLTKPVSLNCFSCWNVKTT